MTNELAAEAAQVIADLTGVASHDCMLTLGSGWGGAANLIGGTVAGVPAEEVPGFSANGVAGHRGTLRSIVLESDRALVLGAQTRFYEGKGIDAVAHGVRTAAVTGAKVCILTNGCGSTVPEWGSGTVALIDDHINLTATLSLRGANFVDLTDLYLPRFREIARGVDLGLSEGVYAQFPGSYYETPAEVRMAKALGADLAEMSTVLEAIAARAAGMEVPGISLVTNYAAGITPSALSHGEALETGEAAGPHIFRLLTDIVQITDRAGSGVARPLADAD